MKETNGAGMSVSSSSSSRGLSLAQLSMLGVGLVLLLVGVLFVQLYKASEKAVRQGSELLVDLHETSMAAKQEVARFLGVPEGLLARAEDAEHLPLLQAPREPALETFLRESMIRNPDLSEFTFTWAQGQVSLVRDTKGELSVVRSSGPEAASHSTYTTLVRERFAGQALWSDLHYSQLDAKMPEAQRRVVVTVQKAIRHEGRLLGVVRVGRSVAQLQRIHELVRIPGWLFLCDSHGRLITPLNPEDTIALGADDELRVVSKAFPVPVVQALEAAKPGFQGANPDWNGKVEAADAAYVVAFRALPGTQGWILGMVWPEGYFLRPLREAGKAMLASAVVISLALIGLVAWGLRRIHADLAALVADTARMRRLDFGRTESTSALLEVREVAESLEGAKATLRAAVKYVPVELIRLLFSRALEPRLGGELRELSLMFTDVEGFTSTAEQLDTNALAVRLAEYLQLMNGAIGRHEGNVLERVGDALLAIWNAPQPAENHSAKICRAALDCLRATEGLEWRTRFGLHCDTVMVGHFGSDDRMNYGVLGDGVNLASRIEGLNKHYGTTILATEPLVEQAGEDLHFRRVDKVAVKGKTQGIVIYELLGEKGQVPAERLALAQTYETAFALYSERKFKEAADLLAGLPDDPPARVLAQRCALFHDSSPDQDWNGVFVATFK